MVGSLIVRLRFEETEKRPRGEPRGAWQGPLALRETAIVRSSILTASFGLRRMGARPGLGD
eukprot:1768438-Pyramimonas_sp.AAC.1